MHDATARAACMHVCVLVHAHTWLCTCSLSADVQSRGQLAGIFFSFHCMSPGDQTQVIRFVPCLYLRTHPAGLIKSESSVVKLSGFGETGQIYMHALRSWKQLSLCVLPCSLQSAVQMSLCTFSTGRSICPLPAMLSGLNSDEAQIADACSDAYKCQVALAATCSNFFGSE